MTVENDLGHYPGVKLLGQKTCVGASFEMR